MSDDPIIRKIQAAITTLLGWRTLKHRMEATL